MINSPYETDLDRNAANFAPLTPLQFLERAALVHPDYPALVYGGVRRTWRQTYVRCRRLASALRRHGVRPGDTVAAMIPNIPEMYESHFGVPMAGAVLNALNIRLDAGAIGFMLRHGAAKVVLVDCEFLPVIRKALEGLEPAPLIVEVHDPAAENAGSAGGMEYESFLKQGDPEFAWERPADEWQAIALNYTSGTTGDPKGVVYHHRGAYLNAVSNVLVWNMARHPVYLWTLPMFHCNGWCFPWTLAAVAGTSVCLRAVRAEPIYDLIRKEKVTHLCGAPVVLNLLANAPEHLRKGMTQRVNFMTAAAPPPAAILEAVGTLGFDVTHTYGLTEVYGPAVVCEWHSEWDELPGRRQAELKARQGVRYPMLEGLVVADPETLQPVPRDGKTIGEVLFRGNIVMKGYLKNPATTQRSFHGGWFHSGDLAVCHPDGYIELKDRSKDIIISGGENISSIEIESVLYRHAAVLEAAVVARPDEKWGETPCAFITLREEALPIDAEDIVAFCREHLAHFKTPRTVVFGPLPKTSTGKIQKFLLRERARKVESEK